MADQNVKMENLPADRKNGGAKRKSNQSRQQLADKLVAESKLVRKESMKVLSEFEKIEDENSVISIL